MTDTNKPPFIIERFYEALDEETNADLTPEQKQAVEQAIISITFSSRHRVDVRESFSFFGKRFYLVFLMGRDLRRHKRKESTLLRIMVTLLVLFALLFCIVSVLLALYMIKSALGIDVFQYFHVGIWDWWLGLKK